MKLTAAWGTVLLVLLAGQCLAQEAEEITFNGRKMTQQFRPRTRRGGSSGDTPTFGGGPSFQPRGESGRDDPSPQDGGSWQFIIEGGVQRSTPRVWNDISNPSEALGFAFGDLVYASNPESQSATRITLNSGQQMVIETTETGLTPRGRFHRFKFTEVGSEILKAGGTSISIVGSEFFIQVSGTSTATIRIGWKSVVDPSRYFDLITTLFEGIVEELVDRFKSVLSGNDCKSTGIDSAFRDISGVCNNPERAFGSAGAPLHRVGEPDFGDGRSSPGGSTISARRISNIVCREDSSSDDGSNKQRLNDMFVFYGQFIDHDIAVTPVGSFARRNQPLFSVSFEKFLDELPIPIPDDDPDFTSKEELIFERAVFVRENNQEVTPRELVNELTSFLDLSQVYGSTASRARALRSFSDGKLKTSGPNFLPFNGDGPGGIGLSLENAPDPTNRFFVGGDIRVQENVNLLALHVIWLREHNKVADEIKSALPSYTDEQIYQTARAICIAEYQSILYKEWLPFILGNDSPSPSGFNYNSGIDASADAFFTTASFRFGHSMISGKLWRVDQGSTTPSSTANLRDVFFNPEVMTGSNFDSWVRGMAWHEAREPDERVIDDLRSFLFTQDGGPSQDLISLNIQRARDMGVPTYNKARQAFGLSTVSSFSDISNNAQTVANLQEAYNGNINDVDSFVAGLAETKPAGRMFGDLFHESIKEQFVRLRDGDRYFYTGLVFDPDVKAAYPRLNTILSDGVKFIDVLARTSGVGRGDIGGRSSVFQL